MDSLATKVKQFLIQKFQGKIQVINILLLKVISLLFLLQPEHHRDFNKTPYFECLPGVV